MKIIKHIKKWWVWNIMNNNEWRYLASSASLEELEERQKRLNFKTPMY